jgi:uncharacterized membrane protein SirB2
MATFTLLHVVLSLVGIASGLVVMFGLISLNALEGWTALFLWTTLATSVTGFGFPFTKFLPSHGVGLISLVVLAVALLARRQPQSRAAHVAYVVSAVLALYLNVFVLVVQSFLKLPFLNALAPTQSEPPFALAQGAVLLAFVALGIVAVRRQRSSQPLTLTAATSEAR